MAVIDVSEPTEFKRKFIGLSTDSKPDARAGSEFFESDTGHQFINTDGGSTWVQVAIS